MSNAPYLTLISEVLPVQRRDFYLADPTLLNPNVSNPILDGEWLALDSDYKLARGSGSLAVNDLLVVGDVTFGGQTKKGLIELPTAAATYWVVGQVTRLPTGKVRYLTCGFRIVVP